MSGKRTRGDWRTNGIKLAYARVARSKENAAKFRSDRARRRAAIRWAKRDAEADLALTNQAKPTDTGNV